MEKRAEEWFDDVADIVQRLRQMGENGSQEENNQLATRLHDLLTLTCHAGLEDTEHAFGNLFSQVDYVCKRFRMSHTDRAAVQRLRYHCNHPAPYSFNELMQDVRALAVLMAAVFRTSIPSRLAEMLPSPSSKSSTAREEGKESVRCIVQSWDNHSIHAVSDTPDGGRMISIDYSEDDYLRDQLYEGMQLNVLFNEQIIVVEPDYMVDISSIAACFEEHGHHPLSFMIHQMMPREVSQAMLLGYFAGAALDEIVNASGMSSRQMMSETFRQYALEFCSCSDFNGQKFLAAAGQQAENIREVARLLFDTNRFDRRKTLVEPSFVCERLGIQGRVDMMTTDFRLLVEQKSGRNFSIESGRVNTYGSLHIEKHYVQLLLYSGVLYYNFRLKAGQTAMNLLYSKYPANKGLVSVAYYGKLFREAIRFRNRLVCEQLHAARNGFATLLPRLLPETLNEKGKNDYFFATFVKPRLDRLLLPLHQLTLVEHDYYTRMMTFVYREMRAAKLGSADNGHPNGGKQAWNSSVKERRESGNLFLGLTLSEVSRSSSNSGYDTIALQINHLGDAFLPNFRRGDMVFLYRYDIGCEPDMCKSILFKGVLQDMDSQKLVVHLNNGQHNAELWQDNTAEKSSLYALEHGASDTFSAIAIRGLHHFMTSFVSRRSLLLGQRTPQCDTNRQLFRSYHPDYDEVLLQAKQALDYYLLIGPPGTGKTSMALRFLVKEELSDERGCVLLTAYTNRAVDEICAMLEEAAIDFLRLGNTYSCEPRFRPYLLEHAVEGTPKLDAIRQRIKQTRVVVGTSSTLQSRPFLLELKRFSLAIVDEASQILEPNIVGLLSTDAIGRFVLVGDHKQLPAVVVQGKRDSQVEEPRLLDICMDDCRHSLFERLLRWERKQGRKSFIGTLRKQGRMHPDIASWAGRMFYTRERLTAVPLPHQEATSLDYSLPSEDALDDLLKEKRMLFVDCQLADEAAVVADLLRRILRFYGNTFNPQKNMGVIVPYRYQIAAIRRSLAEKGIDGLEEVTIDTVERYQGSQRDVMIYSFAVERTSQLDFLSANRFEEDGQTIDRKLNVALTRARCQMIVAGNRKILSSDPIFSQLIDDMSAKQALFTVQ
ncbi:MAG: AAA domain-containing protein [Prevotella sp.]|nr:AAA domain-containing protein [Prevotella sp.]